VSARGDESRQR